MSPLPISRSALDKLGERLAASEEISDADYDLLLRVLTAYQAALVEARERLARLGYEPTTRVKTTDVLIEKLRREQGMKLKGVQDVAGARIVTDGDRSEQDRIVQHIVDEFADGAREPKVRDRRAEPSAGYRAVHVVVTVQGVPVEVQVRTWRQDQWAQIVESLGDKWGRGLRYGAPPDDAERAIAPGVARTRGDFWQLVLSVGETIHAVEIAEPAAEFLHRLRPEDAAGDPVVESVIAERDALLADFAESQETLRKMLSGLAAVAQAVQ